MKTKVILLAVVAVFVFVGYYHERLIDMVGQPQLLLDAVLAATRLAEFSFIAVGLNVLVLLAAVVLV